MAARPVFWVALVGGLAAWVAGTDESSPVLLMPRLPGPDLPASGLGDPAPVAPDNHDQCRSLLSLWRASHPDFRQYQHAKAALEKTSQLVSGSPDPAKGFGRLEVLYRGVRGVAARWKDSPAGQVYAKASDECDDGGEVRFDVFKPPARDQVAVQAAAKRAKCDGMASDLRAKLDRVLVLVREGVRQAQDDRKAASDALTGLRAEWRATRTSLLRSRSIDRLERKVGKLRRQADELEADGDGKSRQLAGFVREELEWRQREVDENKLELASLRQVEQASQRRRELAETDVDRRAALNTSVLTATRQAAGKLRVLERMAANKGGMNQMERAQAAELLEQVQATRLETWRSFKTREAKRLRVDAQARIGELERNAEDTATLAARRSAAAEVLEGSQQALRAQLSTLVAGTERQAVAARLAKLSTRVLHAHRATKQALGWQLQMQQQLQQAREQLAEHTEEKLDSAARLPAVLSGLESLESDLKQNVSRYGVLDSQRALEALDQSKKRLKRQMRQRASIDLSQQVSEAVDGVREQAPELAELVAGLEAKLGRFVCGEPTYNELLESVADAGQRIEPLLANLHSALLTRETSALTAARATIAAQRQRAAARTKATESAREQHRLEAAYSSSTGQARARKIRRLNLARRSAVSAKLELGRAEAAVVATEAAEHSGALWRQVRSKCQIPEHLGAWNACCSSMADVWQWRLPGFSAVANAEALVNAAQGEADQEATEVLTQRLDKIRAGWEASGAGNALAQVTAECTRPRQEEHEAHQNAKRRVADAKLQLRDAKAAEEAAQQDYDAALKALSADRQSLRDVEAETGVLFATESPTQAPTSSANASLGNQTTASADVNTTSATVIDATLGETERQRPAVVIQWGHMVQAAKQRAKAAHGALDTAQYKRRVAQEETLTAMSFLRAARKATEWLKHADNAKFALEQVKGTTLDPRKRTLIGEQLEELKEQQFVVEESRTNADLGHTGSSNGLSRSGLISHYVAEFQAEQTATHIRNMINDLTEAKAKADTAFPMDSDQVDNMLQQLRLDLQSVQENKFETQAVLGEKVRAAKESGMASMSNKQLLLTTQKLLEQRAKAMRDLIKGTSNATNATGLTLTARMPWLDDSTASVEERARATERLAKIDDELFRIANLQRTLAPAATKIMETRQALFERLDQPATNTINGATNNTANDTAGVLSTGSNLGEAIGAKQAGPLHRQVSNAASMATAVLSRLQQELPRLQKAFDNAKTHFQKNRAGKDLQELRTKIQEMEAKTTAIESHRQVLETADKEDTVVRKGLALKKELTHLKQQLTISAMFMAGRSKASDTGTLGVLNASGVSLRLNSLARAQANQRSRDAKLTAARMNTLLVAVQHSLATMPLIPKMRVAAQGTLRRTTVKCKVLRARIAKLKSQKQPEAGSAVAKALEQKLSRWHRQLVKQEELKQAAKDAIESNERALQEHARVQRDDGSGCAKLEDEGLRNQCKSLQKQAETQCHAVHHDAFKDCCSSLVLGWEWGRSKYQAYQAMMLQTDPEPYWANPRSVDEDRANVIRMNNQRDQENRIKLRWLNSEERKVSQAALAHCETRATKDTDKLEALEKAAVDVHTLADQDEPLSELVENAVPTGTADGSVNFAAETQAQLHQQIDQSTEALDSELDEIAQQRRDKLDQEAADAAFNETKRLLEDVNEMSRQGFPEEFTNLGAKEIATDDPKELLRQRKAAFIRQKRAMVLAREMKLAKQSEVETDAVAKKLFTMKQEPPPEKPPQESTPPDYVPHETQLAYLEAKLHRSYAAFLEQTRNAALQLERLDKVCPGFRAALTCCNQAAKRRVAKIQGVRAKLQREYGVLERLSEARLSAVKVKALELTDPLLAMLHHVEQAEDEAEATAESQTEAREKLNTRVKRSQEMVELATGDPPAFDEAAKQAAVRNKKLAEVMNKLNQAANGVVTANTKDAFKRATDRMG